MEQPLTEIPKQDFLSVYSFKISLFCAIYRFEINLKTGPMDGDDVAFHFNPHFCEECSVVCDSFRNRRWENPEETPEGPFSKGGAFDISMAINPEVIEVPNVKN